MGTLLYPATEHLHHLMANNNSTHPEFPNGTTVINVRQNSKYFGQRGAVYGSGPSKKHPNSDAAIIYVCWEGGARNGYFPSRLALAPKAVAEYRVVNKTDGKKKIGIYQIPASKRPRPTILQQATVNESVEAKEE